MDNTEVLIIQCYKDANSKIKSLLKLYTSRGKGGLEQEEVLPALFSPH